MTLPPLTAAETDALRARQKARNKVMGLILGFLALLFFAITIVKMPAKSKHSPDVPGEVGAEQAEHS